MEDNFDNIDFSMSPGKKPLDSSLGYPYVSKNQNHEHDGLVPTNGLAMNEDNVINLGGELTELTPFEEAEGLAPAEDDSEKKNVVMNFINKAIGWLVITALCLCVFQVCCILCGHGIIVIFLGALGSLISTGYAYANDIKYPNLAFILVCVMLAFFNVSLHVTMHLFDISPDVIYGNGVKHYVSIISWFQ